MCQIDLPNRHVKVDLIGERFSVDTVSTQNRVLCVVFCRSSGNEGEFNLVNSSQEWLYNPSTDLATVLLNLSSKSLGHHQIQVLLPVGLVVLIFYQGVAVLVDSIGSLICWVIRNIWLVSLWNVWVNSTSDTNLPLVVKFPYLVEVTKSSSNLILNFNKGVLFFKIKLLILRVLLIDPIVVDMHCFLHKLSRSIEGFIILWLIIVRGLIDSKVVEHVSLISLINENFILILLDDNIPRVEWLRCCHDCSSCNFRNKDICFVILCKSLEDWILKGL
jgi:hypothetical protein